MEMFIQDLRTRCKRLAPFLACFLCVIQASAADPAPAFDGPDNCAECHRPMHATWMHTAHYQTYLSAHRMRSGRRIAERLGIARIKQSETCAKCHYTVQPSAPINTLPIAGVSCESCHGPAEKWNAVHADTTDPDALKKAEALGLIRPGNLVGMVDRCYACHTVNDEKLVNQGGHNPGSDFEMVAWLAGEVRHNFVRTKGSRNLPTSIERKRLFYVIGQIKTLEAAVRETGVARENGEFVDARSARRRRALERLRKIQNRLNIDSLEQVIRLGDSAESMSNDKERLKNTAAAIAKLKLQFASGRDGSKMAAIDDLVPNTDSYIGDVYRP